MSIKRVYTKKEKTNDASQNRRKVWNYCFFAFLPVVLVTVISFVSLVDILEFTYLSQAQAEQAELSERNKRRMELCRQKWPLKGDNYAYCVNRITR